MVAFTLGTRRDLGSVSRLRTIPAGHLTISEETLHDITLVRWIHSPCSRPEITVGREDKFCEHKNYSLVRDNQRFIHYSHNSLILVLPHFSIIRDRLVW